MAAVVAVLITFVDLRGAIGLSGVTVLVYYAITNASALTLTAGERRWPPAIAVAGLLGCVTLAVALPVTSIVVGATVLAVGFVARLALRGGQQ